MIARGSDLSTDHEIMLAVQGGEVDKLGLLFERHHKHLYNFFLRQTGERQTSEDLVQDVFYRMLKYKHTYRAEGKFTTWMFSIAHNMKIDFYRKKRLDVDEMSEADTLMDKDLNPHERMEKEAETALIQKALELLSDDKREVLLLSRYEDLQYEDIGEIMRCKVGTVKARVHRAIKDLTDHYYKLTGEKSS
ncbi:MAG: RNA polymerase sigma factor [bacterium]